MAVLELIAELLEAAGYTVLSATTARAGLDHVRARRPDLVVMDASPSDMRGADAIRALKVDPGRGRSPSSRSRASWTRAP